MDGEQIKRKEPNRQVNKTGDITMKYFVAEIDGEEEILGKASAAKAFLTEHPEVMEVWRYWWSGNDLIDCEKFTRGEMFDKSVKKLSRGETAQWAYSHGRL